MIDRLAKEYDEMLDDLKIPKHTSLTAVNDSLGSDFKNEIIEAFDIYILLLTLANVKIIPILLV